MCLVSEWFSNNMLKQSAIPARIVSQSRIAAVWTLLLHIPIIGLRFKIYFQKAKIYIVIIFSARGNFVWIRQISTQNAICDVVKVHGKSTLIINSTPLGKQPLDHATIRFLNLVSYWLVNRNRTSYKQMTKHILIVWDDFYYQGGTNVTYQSAQLDEIRKLLCVLYRM